MTADIEQTPMSILEYVYNKAVNNVKKGVSVSTNDFETDMQIQTLVENSTKQKAVVTALITSLVKKIEDPTQNVRLHKVEFDGGYSGRSYDTRYITPFLKKNLPRIAMKESGWLTRSIEQPEPFDKDFPGKIQNRNVKIAFLSLLEKVEEGKIQADFLLEVILTKLVSHLKESSERTTRNQVINKSAMISEIISNLNTHFACKRSSFLPVVAIYSMYQVVIKEVSRYRGKRLLPLKSHTTSDVKARSLGDIEIVNSEGNLFEGVEIKHNIPIDELMVIDVIQKITGRGVDRYYILTTASPEIKDGEEDKIVELVKDFKEKDGCEIVINGIFPTLKYYLRLIKNPKGFIQSYSKNLVEYYKQSSSVSEEHLITWNQLLESLSE